MEEDWRKDAEGSDFVSVPYRVEGSEVVCLIFETREPTRENDQWGKDVWDWPVKICDAFGHGIVSLSGSRILRVRSKRQLRLLVELFDAHPETTVKGEMDKDYHYTFTFWRTGANMDTQHHGLIGEWVVDLDTRHPMPLAQIGQKKLPEA